MKIRASAIGQVMTNSRKKGELSKTCQSYVQKVLKEELYGVRSMFSNKYTDKGNIMEDEAIDLVASFYDLGIVVKNEDYFTNDFIKGTPDVILNDSVRDIKCSWDVGTFPLYQTEVPNKDYYWQLQGYMWLTDKEVSYLDYCLMDTPPHLISSEARSMAYRFGDEISQSQHTDLVNNMTFSRHPEAMRIKTFRVDRDEESIEQIKNRVTEINNYINTL